MTSPAKHNPSTFLIVSFAAVTTTSAGLINGAWQGGWNVDGALAATRITARLAFLWFIAAWSASALAYHWQGGWRTTLLRRRRAIGLGFAAAHGVHLIALTLAIGYFGHETSVVAIVGGGFVYVVLLMMAITSTNSWIARLGPKQWKKLHTFGGWAAFAIFTNSYLGRLESQPMLAIGALSLLAFALGLQFSKIVSRHVKA